MRNNPEENLGTTEKAQEGCRPSVDRVCCGVTDSGVLSEDDGSAALLSKGQMYAAEVGDRVLPAEILTVLAHPVNLGANELLRADCQAVYKVAETLSKHTPGRESEGGLLVEDFLGDGCLTRLGRYISAVIQPFAVLDQCLLLALSTTDPSQRHQPRGLADLPQED